MLSDREYWRNSDPGREVVRACAGDSGVRLGIPWRDRSGREELRRRGQLRGRAEAERLFPTNGHHHEHGMRRSWNCHGLRCYRKWAPQTLALGLILLSVGALLS